MTKSAPDTPNSKPATQNPIASPCISICALDEDDICIGCYRSAAEIREWSVLDNGARKQVLKNSMWRARRANPFA